MLPLQGFWNAVVYVVTSQTACAGLWRGAQELPDAKSGRGGGGGKSSDGGGGGGLELDNVNGGIGGPKGRDTCAGATTKFEKLAGGLGSLNGNGKGMKKSGGARMDRRTSQRLESDDCSVASFRGR